MEEIYEKTLLYDFYGELLTAHRREIYEAVVFNDMSLSEAAAEYGVSRQGIHDVIRKCEEALRDYESKLHMVEQFGILRSLTNSLTKDLAENGHLTETEKKKFTKTLKQMKDVIG